MKKSYFDAWAAEIIAAREPLNFTQTQRFVELLYEVDEVVSIEVGYVLFRLFTDGEDNGVKQHVVCLLSGYPVYEYYRSLLLALPEMLKQCLVNDWPYSAADYWGRDLQDGDLGELLRAYFDSTAEEKESFLKIILSQAFFHDHSWPAEFIKLVRKREKNGI